MATTLSRSVTHMRGIFPSLRRNASANTFVTCDGRNGEQGRTPELLLMGPAILA
jgi:hypothetical protein